MNIERVNNHTLSSFSIFCNITGSCCDMINKLIWIHKCKIKRNFTIIDLVVLPSISRMNSYTWKGFAPPKIEAFVLLVILDKLDTKYSFIWNASSKSGVKGALFRWLLLACTKEYNMFWMMWLPRNNENDLCKTKMEESSGLIHLEAS